jgi:hypothetical protein
MAHIRKETSEITKYYGISAYKNNSLVRSHKLSNPRLWHTRTARRGKVDIKIPDSDEF